MAGKYMYSLHDKSMQAQELDTFKGGMSDLFISYFISYLLNVLISSSILSSKRMK